MSTFRFLDQAPQFFTRDGEVLAGGSLTFYTTGTSNKLDTYTSKSLSSPNTNPVPLNADGRASSDIWMNGSYRVVLAGSNGAIQWTRDNVEGPESLPDFNSGDAGYFLSTNGEDLLWVPVRQPPDPSGQIGKILASDGVNIIWQNPPAAFNPPVSSQKIQLGNTLIQWGTDTIPASGTSFATKSITFPISFASVYHVSASVSQGSGVSGTGNIPAIACYGWTPTGASTVISFPFVSGGASNITLPCNIAWFAIGTAS